MQTITGTIEIDSPSVQVWDALADFGNINRFNPNLSASHSTSAEPNGVGATRHCDLRVGGASIEERIVEWDEGSSYVVDIYEGKRNPFAKASAFLGVEAIDAARSLVTIKMKTQAKGGALSGVIGKGLAGQSSKALSAILAGLKHHVETGEEVGAGQKVPAEMVSIS